MTQHVGQRIGYARVSTTDQNLARQIEALGEVDQLFTEQQSGAKRAGRPKLAEMIAYARNHDVVVVSSMDRAARSVVDLHQIVSELLAKGATVEFIAERLVFAPDATDAFAELQLNLMGAFAQFEHAIIRERQADGIRAAKQRGVYRGRSVKLEADQIQKARDLIGTGIPKSKVARKFGVDRSTLYRALERE